MSERITDQSVTVQMSAGRLHDLLVQMYITALVDVRMGRTTADGPAFPIADEQADCLNSSIAHGYSVKVTR